jgi:hypothetical protein
MLFDDLSLFAKILIGAIAPPLVTIFCWLVGPRLAGFRRNPARTRSWLEFWLMLLAAYVIFALALWGIRFFPANDHADPSIQLLQ